MKINGESTSVNVLPWDPFATFKKCNNNYVLAIGLFRAFPSKNFFPLDGIIPSNLEIRGNIFS
jgi:hypothetical protein